MEKINNTKNKNITVLGAGISGQGAACLSNYLGAKVLLSDCKKNKRIDNNVINNKIKIELGSHSAKCFNSDLVIVSPGINLKTNSIIKKLISKNIPIIGEIEFASWFTKSPIIAITGSNGKSTMVKMLYEIFSKKFKNVYLGGNIGISFSKNVLNELKNNYKECIHILEISSFQLETIFTFKPEISCILNVSKDHMDRYKNVNEYFNTKTNITKNICKKSHIVYNQDDKKLHNYYKNFSTSIPYSLKEKNNLCYSESKNIFSNNNEIIINQNDTNLIGNHNLQNILAAITIAKFYKIKNSHIKSSLKGFNPLPHRMEKINLNNKLNFINDSKSTNIYSTISAIKSFEKKIILILGGYSKKEIEYKLIKSSINKDKIIQIICYGEAGEKLTPKIKKIKPVLYFKFFKDAVIQSIKFATKENIILLSPAFKSFDQFNNFEERGNDFKKTIKGFYYNEK